jgi:hypothetical protein
MKRLVLTIILISALFSFSSIPAHAMKSVSCQAALRGCIQSCQGTFGDFPGLTEGCISGCNIGYLLC